MRRILSLKTAMMALAILATVGLTAMPALAEQQTPAPPGEVGFMGANPSGKLGRDGKPLVSKPGGPSTMRSKDAAPSFKAECPPTVRCVVIPAAYSPNNGNVEDYGNYDKANRPVDMAINSVVIHDTEGDLQSVLDAFRDPTFYASSHYVIDADGTIYQMLQNKDMGWHAGNWSVNMHSIGIEHVGHAALGGTEYTPAIYKASSQLVKYLTEKYNIKRDRAHIIGHDNVPARDGASVSNMHVDPGPFWNWQNYMAMIGAPVIPSGGFNSKLVTIAPVWPLNKQPVTGCWPVNQSCAPSQPQPTNFVYLRTEPRSDASFFTDPATGQGSTELSNNAARLFHGQTFAVADRRVDHKGVWYQVWVNGQKGWFHSPWKTPTAFPASGKYVTPKASLASVATYGRAIPERSEYPADLLAVPPASWYVPTPSPLPYTMTGGQRYKLVDSEVPTDHFYAWASDSSFPYDHTVFKGSTRYLMVQLGNRTGYVKAADVDIR